MMSLCRAARKSYFDFYESDALSVSADGSGALICVSGLPMMARAAWYGAVAAAASGGGPRPIGGTMAEYGESILASGRGFTLTHWADGRVCCSELMTPTEWRARAAELREVFAPLARAFGVALGRRKADKARSRGEDRAIGLAICGALGVTAGLDNDELADFGPGLLAACRGEAPYFSGRSVLRRVMPALCAELERGAVCRLVGRMMYVYGDLYQAATARQVPCQPGDFAHVSLKIGEKNA